MVVNKEINSNNNEKNEIIIFENQDVKLEVNMKDETVWLNLEQMTRLFGRDKSVISRHIRNIFSEGELEHNGIAFRKWATKILKDYMLKGYAANQKRLEYLEKTIKLIDIANRIDEKLEGNDANLHYLYTF